MPELPDVEGFAAVLREHGMRRRIRAVSVNDASVLHDTSGRQFIDAVTGRVFGPPHRHGKWLFAPIRAHNAGELMIAMHFGMTGSLEWHDPDAARERHDRITFCLARGELRYRDMRKLKGFTLTDQRGIERIVADLGPDAAAVRIDDLDSALRTSRRGVKSALMDQAVIAGLGNLLADEILWRAHLDPRRPTDSLTRADIRRLHGRMGATLRSSVRAGRVPGRPSWLTGHRDEDPGRCPRCGTRLRHERLGGRATVSCPTCQPR